MHRSLKGKLVIGLAALALAAFAGGAYAATQNSGSNQRQAFLDDVAKRLHVTSQQLSSALNGAFLDQLQTAVKDGRLTQAQANAIQQRLKQNGAAPGVPFGLFGPGPHALRPWSGPAPGLGFGFGLGLAAGPGGLNAAAGYLGMTDEQLARQLAGGKSLAQIATAHGKTVSGLENAMTAAFKTRLDKLVAAKLITATQEQKILSRFSARLSSEVNRKDLAFRGKIPLPHLRFPNGVPTPPAAPGSVPLPQATPAPIA